MKQYTKILIAIFLFNFISLSADTTVFAKSNVLQTSKSDSWAMSLSEIEKISGLKSDGKIKVSSPLSGKTYKTGDSIPVKWSNENNQNDITSVMLVYEDILFPISMYDVENNKNFHNFVVTDEMPSGTYFIMLGDADSKTHFAISNNFTVKTKISTKDIEENLSNAQEKASDAAAKANLSNARVQAELYYDTVGSYINVCTKGTQTNYGIKDSVAAAKKSTGKKADCDSSATAWAAEVQLKSNNMYFCVDSTGYAKDQKKSKGSKATGCDGSKSTSKNVVVSNSNNSIVTKNSDIKKLKVLNLENKYTPEKITKFSVKVEDSKGKSFTVSDRSFTISAMMTQINTGYSSQSISLGSGTYNVKNKVWDFDVVMPSKIGKYVIDITAYCSNLNKNSECYKKIGDTSPYTNVYVTIEGNVSSASRSLIKVISPNGGEKITNTGSVDIKYTIPTGGSYFSELYLMPSSNTDFTLTNPKEGVRGYSLGGSGSPYSNYISVQGGVWNIGSVPDGKYKLRAYLYPYRENVQYSFSEAIGMDESDGYFIINTSNSNRY